MSGYKIGKKPRSYGKTETGQTYGQTAVPYEPDIYYIVAYQSQRTLTETPSVCPGVVIIIPNMAAVRITHP